MTFDSVNKTLRDTSELEIKQPILQQHLVPVTDASFRSAGYALMVEDKPAQKMQSKQETYAPVAFGSSCPHAQFNMSNYSNEFLAIYMAFLKFAKVVW